MATLDTMRVATGTLCPFASQKSPDLQCPMTTLLFLLFVPRVPGWSCVPLRDGNKHNKEAPERKSRGTHDIEKWRLVLPRFGNHLVQLIDHGETSRKFMQSVEPAGVSCGAALKELADNHTAICQS